MNPNERIRKMACVCVREKKEKRFAEESDALENRFVREGGRKIVCLLRVQQNQHAWTRKTRERGGCSVVWIAGEIEHDVFFSCVCSTSGKKQRSGMVGGVVSVVQRWRCEIFRMSPGGSKKFLTEEEDTTRKSTSRLERVRVSASVWGSTYCRFPLCASLFRCFGFLL